MRRQIGDWKAEWFYIDNHAPALPERTPGPPKQRNEWYAHAENLDQVGELLKRIAKRWKEGVSCLVLADEADPALAVPQPPWIQVYGTV